MEQLSLDKLRAMFPNVSKSTLDANNLNHDTGSAPKLECNPKPRPLAKGKAKARDTGLVFVSVTSVRARLIDEDNLCEKYHVDACRYAGLLHGDSPEQTQIRVCQRKAEKGEEEHTLIQITYPE